MDVAELILQSLDNFFNLCLLYLIIWLLNFRYIDLDLLSINLLNFSFVNYHFGKHNPETMVQDQKDSCAENDLEDFPIATDI